MEPCWLSLIVDGTAWSGIGGVNPWNIKKQHNTKDIYENSACGELASES